MRLIPESYEIFLDDLHKDLSRLKKICVVLFPFGVLIGAINIILYSIRIGHVPQGLSIADGFMFITVAAIFGMMLYAINFILLIPAIFVRNCFFLLINKQNYKSVLNVVCPILIAIIFAAMICLYLVLVFSHNNSILLILLLVFLFILLQSVLYKIIEIEKKQKEMNTNLYGIKAVQCLLVFFITFGCYIYFLDLDVISMRVTNIRAENVTIYVKKPYSYLLRTKELTKIKVNSNKSEKDEGMSLYGFEKFDKATVLLRGFGGITMVSVGGNKLEIPNDYIIIPIKDKTQNLHR